MCHGIAIVAQRPVCHSTLIPLLSLVLRVTLAAVTCSPQVVCHVGHLSEFAYLCGSWGKDPGAWLASPLCVLPSHPCFFFCLHGELLGSLSVLLLPCESQAFGTMSDVEATVLDTDEELVGADLVPADRLFAAEEFFLPISAQ